MLSQWLHEFLHLLAVNHQIDNDICTAKFLEDFTCNEKYICTLFESIADSNLKKIFSVYANNVNLVSVRPA